MYFVLGAGKSPDARCANRTSGFVSILINLEGHVGIEPTYRSLTDCCNLTRHANDPKRFILTIPATKLSFSTVVRDDVIYSALRALFCNRTATSIFAVLSCMLVMFDLFEI